MNPTNWKKQAATRALPFLKTFARKVKRKFRPDLDDIHDVGDMTKHTETPGLWQKGLMLGLDVVDPVSGAIALTQQGKEDSFLYDLSTSLPELPASGGTQIGWNPETDIGRRSGEFIIDKSKQALDFLHNQAIALGTGIKQGYDDYQLAREYDKLERNIATIQPVSVPVTSDFTSYV